MIKIFLIIVLLLSPSLAFGLQKDINVTLQYDMPSLVDHYNVYIDGQLACSSPDNTVTFTCPAAEVGIPGFHIATATAQTADSLESLQSDPVQVKVLPNKPIIVNIK